MPSPSVPPFRSRDSIAPHRPACLYAQIRYQPDTAPVVRLQGGHPATAWMAYLHLPLGFLARVMFTMPTDAYYGCQYLLQALQDLEGRAHLESLSLELTLGLGRSDPGWIERPVQFRLRQRARRENHFFTLEAAMPADCPAAQAAQAFVQLTLEVLRHLPSRQGGLLLYGLRRMARAYRLGEVNPYDWKSLVAYPQVVLDELVAGLARQAAAEA